ncbi:MAG: SUMF1/EgtB/PvdO family nonheme iron enzyme [Candidatus Accumulibacter phosphatis]
MERGSHAPRRSRQAASGPAEHRGTGPAARGREGRRYAWGEAFDPSRCNSFETHVRGPTPVGVFPGRDTPQGLADICGNVFEWTGSLYRAYRYEAGDGRENPDDGERPARGARWLVVRQSPRTTRRTSPPGSVSPGSSYWFRHHSQTFPAMSWQPQGEVPCG